MESLLTFKVFEDDGTKVKEFKAVSHKAGLDYIVAHSGLKNPAAPFKIRIEDENGNGCWMLVAGRNALWKS
jgi:hypothetical protein